MSVLFSYLCVSIPGSIITTSCFRDELATANRKIDEYKSKLVICESLSSYTADGDRKFGGVCLKCGQHEALLAAPYDQSGVIQALTR